MAKEKRKKLKEIFECRQRPETKDLGNSEIQDKGIRNAKRTRLKRYPGKGGLERKGGG